MIIRFNYNYNMTFYFRTYSELTIDGTGEWNVDRIDLCEEWDQEKYDAEEFINNYLYLELDIDPDFVKFNKEDLDKLIEFMKEYKESTCYES